MIYPLRPCDGEAVYSTDDLYIRFSCRMVVDHYGVPGSPMWLAVDEDSIDIAELEVDGKTLDARKLPQSIRDQYLEFADGLDFVQVEREYE
jgi:hypothetical protein